MLEMIPSKAPTKSQHTFSRPKSETPVLQIQRRQSIVLIAAILAIFTICSVFKLSPLVVPNVTQLSVGFPKSSNSPSVYGDIKAQNAAVIIDNRPLAKLAPLLLHFSSVLGPAWQIILYTSLDHAINPTSAPVRRAIDAGRIDIRYAPREVEFNRNKIAEFLTLPWIWEQLAPAKDVLMFQADTIICANSPISVDDFLHYDFVRVPMDLPGGDFDGGLSLRNRSMTLEITRSSNWIIEKSANDSNAEGVKLADKWLTEKMKQMGARLPKKELAIMFSVQRIWHNAPLSYHRVSRWHPDKIEMVDQWCPEHRLFTLKPLSEG